MSPVKKFRFDVRLVTGGSYNAIDASERELSLITEEAIVTFGFSSHVETYPLHVKKLRATGIILGMNWLRYHDPDNPLFDICPSNNGYPKFDRDWCEGHVMNRVPYNSNFSVKVVNAKYPRAMSQEERRSHNPCLSRPVSCLVYPQGNSADEELQIVDHTSLGTQPSAQWEAAWKKDTPVQPTLDTSGTAGCKIKHCRMPRKYFGSPFGHRRSQCILLWAMPESLTGSTKPTEGRIAQPMVALINSTVIYLLQCITELSWLTVFINSVMIQPLGARVHHHMQYNISQHIHMDDVTQHIQNNTVASINRHFGCTPSAHSGV
ncbi:hypothetical protein PROFUN_16462 [Planoprotostelium fungivorum]|uniref:Uncharacterized protein n=1 Tax=Planoprotostelium fungivorum TaxID=1890364 RepID=A0A2P6MQN9_9EUKA|nr:hypothetical protein PROFUN_16462 [Planoprotostelium fungivorum]